MYVDRLEQEADHNGAVCTEVPLQHKRGRHEGVDPVGDVLHYTALFAAQNADAQRAENVGVHHHDEAEEERAQDELDPPVGRDGAKVALDVDQTGGPDGEDLKDEDDELSGEQALHQ
eukprot:scaffold73185_cov31-Tisochrysis_lutea.AAC.2